MKKKNLAWLLTAAMVAGSVEGPVAVASGAEFSAGPEEVQEAETVVEESGSQEQDVSLTDGNETVSEFTDPEQSESLGTEFTAPQQNESGDAVTAFDSDDEDEDDDEVDDWWEQAKASAVEMTLGEKAEIQVDESYEDYYFKFTAPEDGIYTFDYDATDRDGDFDEDIDYSVSYLDEDGENTNETVELEKGCSIYVKLQNSEYYGYKFFITASSRPYMVKNLELISGPSDTEYIEGIDCKINNTPNNNSVKLDGLKVRVTYSDGETEELTPGMTGRDGKSEISASANWSEEDTEENGIVWEGWLGVSYDGEALTNNIPLTFKSISSYITESGTSVEAIASGDQKAVTWNGYGGYLYKFVPSNTAEYIFSSKTVVEDEDDENYLDTYGYLLDNKGSILSEDDDNGGNGNFSVRAELEAGKTYYYLARPYSVTYSKSTLSLQEIRSLKSITLDSTETQKYIGIDDLSYSGLEKTVKKLNATLHFTDGSEETISWGDITADGYSLSVDIPEVDRENPGTYVLKVSSDSVSADYTIKVLSAMDYMKDHAQELQAGKRTAVTIPADTSVAYCVTAPETGYYGVKYQSHSEADLALFDEQGNKYSHHVRVEKGQKFYFSLANTGNMDIKALVTPQQLDVVLKNASVTTPPTSTTLIEYVDCDNGETDPENAGQIMKGLKVTAEYSDGEKETLSYGDTGRLGDKLSGYLKWEYKYDSEEGTSKQTVVMILTMGEENIAEVPLTWIPFSEYLSKGEGIEALTVNTDKQVETDNVYSFTAEKDGEYTFFSKGEGDPFGYLYSENGDWLTSNDDSGDGMNFLITYELEKGSKYYLRVRTRGTSCSVKVSDGSKQETEKEELSDFQLISAPVKTIFFSHAADRDLDTNRLPAAGLKISAKNKNGETVVYSYDDDDEFPFEISAEFKYDEDDYYIIPGEYTAKVLYQGQTAAEYPIVVKSFRDYLKENTKTLKPGETIGNEICEYTNSGTYLYVKLPSDLKGRYIYCNQYRWNPDCIYDNDGNETNLRFDQGDDWDFNGKDYYLCLENGYVSDDEEENVFWYDQIPSSGLIQNLEIISQPEITEYPQGMEQSVDLKGMVIRITYKDGTQKVTEAEDYNGMYLKYTSIKDKDGTTVYDVSNLPLGENQLYLTMSNAKVPFTINVKKLSEMNADPLTLEKEEVFSITESSSYHVYSYTPEKTGSYKLLAAFKNIADSTTVDGTKVRWYMADENGESQGENYSSYRLRADKKYYFVVCAPEESFADISVKLSGKNINSGIVDLELTAPSKTEYQPDEEAISYEGMIVKAVYEDGTERDFTAEEAEAAGIQIKNDVNYGYKKKFPGSYKITVSYEDPEDYYTVEKTLPITVAEADTTEITLGETPVELAESKDGRFYKFQISADGYYQLHITGQDAEGFSAKFKDEWMKMNGYSSLHELKAGTYYLYIDGAACSVSMTAYNSEPTAVVIEKLPEKTEFVYGQDEVTFAGAQFRVTFADGSEKIVTVPEGFGSFDIMETGIEFRRYTTDKVGSYSVTISVPSGQHNTKMDYSIVFPEDMVTLEDGKSYEVKASQLKNNKQVVYKVVGSDQGGQIITVEYGQAYARVIPAQGYGIGYVTSQNPGVLYFAAEKGKTYYVVLSGLKNGQEQPDITVKYSTSKAITKLTPLEDTGTYYYGVNDSILGSVRLQLTYVDGSTEVITQNETRGWLTRLDMEQVPIRGTGTYQGTISLAGIKTGYSRKIEMLPEEEIKAEQLVETQSEKRYKFVPEKTQSYYLLSNVNGELDVDIENADGANLDSWALGSECREGKMVLTAGRTYYFRVNGAQGNFAISTDVGVAVSLKDSKTTYTYSGEPIRPELTVTYDGNTLQEGKDYQIRYYDNVEFGTARAEVVPVSGGMNFVSRTVYFGIDRCSLKDSEARIEEIPDQEWTGEAITPDLKVTCNGRSLENGVDYQVSFKNNVEIGTAEVTVEGIDNYTGTLKAEFTIREQQKKLVEKISLNKTSANVVAGNSVQLTATVSPDDAADTSVKWTSSSKYASVDDTGKVTVKSNAPGGYITITASANDESGVTASCKIKVYNKITYNLNGGKQNKSNKTSFCKQTVKLYSPTRAKYTFGGWYTDKGLKKKITSISNKTTKNVTLYAKWKKVTQCSAPSKVTLKNSKAKTMAVSIKSVSGAKGYEITYSTSSKFSGAKKKTITGKTVNIGSLSKRKTYYVKVRAYKLDSTGAKVYGKYSKTVKVQIKK